ncbi:MAG: hypothetical protein ACYDBB_19150 [Armatimonadota bacterium]
MSRLIVLLGLFLLCASVINAADQLPYPMPSAEEQAARKQQLLQWGKRWLLQYGRPFDQPAVNYPANVPPPQGDGAGNTQALFALGSPAEVAQAIKLMAQVGPDKGGTYGIFQGPALMEIWFRYADKLPPETKAHFLKEIESISAPKGRLWGCCDTNCAGGNWGFCSAAGVGLAGEILGDQARLDRGKYALKLALDQIRQYGAIMEYNSPTYYGPSFAGLNAIAIHARDPEFRGMARAISNILLMQTLSFYHPASEQVSGPWQRCYGPDVYGGPSSIKSLIYPYLPQPPFMEMRHLWQFPSMVGISGMMMGFGGTDVYFPSWLGMFVTNRPQIWNMGLTSHVPQIKERRGLGTLYPSHDINVEVYQTPVYTFGSASYVFHNGAHAETPYLAWSMRSPVKGLGDFKTGFFRLLHHDALIEGNNNESVFDKGNLGYVLWNEGRKFAYQHENRAILFAHPDRIVPETTRLGLSFFASELEFKVDEVWLGDKKVTTFPAVSDTPQQVVIKDGKFYLALIPLPENDNLGRTNAVEIRHTSTNYLQVSFLNYQGARHAMQDWAYARNGLYVETADTNKYPTTRAFLDHLKQIEISEVDQGDVRSVSVQSPDGKMEADYDKKAEAFLLRTFNDMPYAPPAFTSPRAALGLQGKAAVGKTSVTCDPPQPIALAADADRQVYVLLNFGAGDTTAQLTLPGGKKMAVPLHPYEEKVLYKP